MPLILASYRITSILHTVLSTVTVSVFIEEKNLNRPSPLAPAPFLGVFWGVRTYVRTMPLILANSYRITSILHTVLSTVTVSVFIEKKI